MLSQLILLGILTAPPSTFKKAQERYGKLDDNYVMVDKDKWIVPFSFEPFGLKYKTQINKDLVLPLTFVLRELQLTGLIKEITGFQGCYSARAIRGSERPSIHAYGLGCDFNHTKFSSEFVDVWKRYGFSWGGDFCSWKDWMHFSYSYEKGNCNYYGQPKESDSTT